MPLVITETRKNRDVALGGVQVIQSAGPLVEAAQEQKDLWESAPKQERPKSDAAILKEGRRARLQAG